MKVGDESAGPITQSVHVRTDEARADAADFAGVDFVIEAVFESVELKHKVFGEIEDIVEPNALLGSNTSTLPITGLAAGVKRQEDFIGLWIF